MLDSGAEHVPQQRAHVLDQRRDICRPHLEPLDPAEGKQLRGQARAAFGRSERVLGIELELLVLGALGDDVEPADDDRQQIVEVVRDAAGQLAERFHLLALPQLLLGGLELGDVARFEQQIDDLAFGPVNRLHRHVEVRGRRALALHPHFLCKQLSGRGVLHRALHQLDVLRIGAQRRRLPDFLAHPVARVRRPPRRFLAVELDDGAVRLHQHQHLQHGVEHRPEPRFAQRQLARPLLDAPPKLELGFLGQRDVGRRPDEADMLAVGPEPRAARAPQPAIGAVAAAEPPFQREGLQRRLAGDQFRR